MKKNFNNIEENKFVIGYVHYTNSRNKIVYKRAIGYIVPEEDMIFCISSYNFKTKNTIENSMYEKSTENEKLYISSNGNTVFELKKYIYPDSNRKISINELMELTPLLEKYVLDEDFELDEELVINKPNDNCPKLRKVAKQLLKKVAV